MRKILAASLVLLVLAIAAVAAFLLLRRPQQALVSGPPPPPVSPARLEAQDVPPLPNLSVQISGEQAPDVFQGTPLIFTVRVANQRAANAASTLQAHEAYLALIQEKIAKKEISAADAEPMLALARQKPDVKVVRLGTSEQGWETFLHFEAEHAGAAPERLTWPLQAVTPPPSRSLVLDGSSTAQLDYALNPDAAAQVPAGEYSIIAVLEVPAGATLPQDLWRGRVASAPAKLTIAPPPAAAAPADRAKMNLQRAEFFSAIKDWTNALASAQAALKEDPNLIRAQILQGEALEAQGDLAGARDAFSQALQLFDEQNPDSYERPQYLIHRLAALDARLGPGR